MVKSIPKLFLIPMFLIVALACVVPGVATPDPNFINRAIAQTQTAAPGIPITGPESPTPTMTRAASATPFPTFTLVAFGAPQLRVSEDTTCRTGPGEIYDRVGVLRVGAVAVVVGRSADGNYWVIRNPDRAGETCWIAEENATLTGAAGILPVFPPPPTPTPTNTSEPTSTPTRTHTPTRTPTSSFTPTATLPISIPTSTSSPTPSFTPTSSTPTATPTITSTLSPTPTSSSTPTSTPSSTSTSTPTSTPSPTSTPTPTAILPPGFNASFEGLDSCAGTGWWVDLALENTGGVVFESLNVILSDTVTGTALPFNSEDFINQDECSTTDTEANLPPGVTHFVSLPVLTYDPTGHDMEALVVLCSDPGQSGQCISEGVSFTP